jgi:hypothetical protein
MKILAPFSSKLGSIARLDDVFSVGLRRHELECTSVHGIVKRSLNNMPKKRHTGLQQ